MNLGVLVLACTWHKQPPPPVGHEVIELTCPGPPPYPVLVKEDCNSSYGTALTSRTVAVEGSIEALEDVVSANLSTTVEKKVTKLAADYDAATTRLTLWLQTLCDRERQDACDPDARARNAATLDRLMELSFRVEATATRATDLATAASAGDQDALAQLDAEVDALSEALLNLGASSRAHVSIDEWTVPPRDHAIKCLPFQAQLESDTSDSMRFSPGRFTVSWQVAADTPVWLSWSEMECLDRSTRERPDGDRVQGSVELVCEVDEREEGLLRVDLPGDWTDWLLGSGASGGGMLEAELCKYVSFE